MTEPKTYRKKPVEVQAVQFDGNNRREVLSFVYPGMSEDGLNGAEVMQLPVVIATLEGEMTVSPGDFVIRGVAGEFLEEFGDGLVIGQSRPDEVWGYPPLYARDLQALINAVRLMPGIRLQLDNAVREQVIAQDREMAAEKITATVTDQRDQARDIAVHLEQELAEAEQRVKWLVERAAAREGR